jgi:hypothetical protein
VCGFALILSTVANAQMVGCPPRECQPDAAVVPYDDSVAGAAGYGDNAGPTRVTPRERREDAISRGICADLTC